MVRRRHSPEQVIGKLRDGEVESAKVRDRSSASLGMPRERLTCAVASGRLGRAIISKRTSNVFVLISNEFIDSLPDCNQLISLIPTKVEDPQRAE